MKPHVLVVDDSVLVTSALRLLLEETGHRVSIAGTVREGIVAARTGRPDIILLDVNLGIEDGLDILADLARTGDLAVVTVAVTGHDDSVVRERCLGAGCREVLVKPISARELPQLICGWLLEARSAPTPTIRARSENRPSA